MIDRARGGRVVATAAIVAARCWEPAGTGRSLHKRRRSKPPRSARALTGIYDFTLTWTPIQARQTLDAAALPDTAGASLFIALQEQIGLRLTGGRGPVDVLVIDSVEQPSEN